MLTEEYERIATKNEQVSEQKCEELVCRLCKTLDSSIRSGDYAVDGGYETFQNDMETIQREYEDTKTNDSLGPKVGFLYCTTYFNLSHTF